MSMVIAEVTDVVNRHSNAHDDPTVANLALPWWAIALIVLAPLWIVLLRAALISARARLAAPQDTAPNGAA